MRPLAGPLLAALLALAARATAQTSPEADTALEVTLARTLLAEGRQLLGEGRFRVALEKLEASASHDRRPETLLEIGACHEGLGAITSAWGAYHGAEERARALGEAAPAAEAAKRAADLLPRLTRLKVVVQDPAPGIAVTLDHRTLGRDAWGTALPVDPGQHWVKATAPEKRGFARQITLSGEGVETTVTIPALSPPPPLPLPEPRGLSTSESLTLAAQITGGILVAGGYTAGLLMLADANASAPVRRAGAVMGGGTLLVGAVWLGVTLRSLYRPTARQTAGAVLMAAGTAAAGSGLIVLAEVLVQVPVSEPVAIAAIAGGCAAPLLLLPGYFIMGRDPWEPRHRPPIAIAPILAPARAGLSLQGTF